MTPLLPAAKPAQDRTLEDKQAAACAVIEKELGAFQNVLKYHVGNIRRELSQNRDKLTEEQVCASLGKERAAALPQALAELEAWAKEYLPGALE